MNILDYPVTIIKIKQTITRYLTDAGILCKQMPFSIENNTSIYLPAAGEFSIFSHLRQHTASNMNKNSSPAVTVLSQKNVREIVMLRGNGCTWRRCRFCDNHMDFTADQAVNLV